MRRWGHLPDAQICSCGNAWNACSFWGPIIELNGLRSTLSLPDKYADLLTYVRTQHGQTRIIVDSSKSLETFDLVLNNIRTIGLDMRNIHVVLLVKDVRNFAASVARRSRKPSHSLAHLRTFNWWAHVNRKYLSYLKDTKLSYDVVSYEHLCFETTETLNRILKRFDLGLCRDLSNLERRSHIAMGNKNFTMRNIDRIRYDDTWMADSHLDFAYAIHPGARRLNQTFYHLSRR